MKINKSKFSVAIFLMVLFTYSCKEKRVVVMNNTAIIHQNQDELTQVIIYDIFTPPVASRIYAYTSLAAYEAIRFLKPNNESLAEKMNGFGKMPIPDVSKKYNYTLAATQAFFSVAHKVTFSIDTLKKYENIIFENYKNTLDEAVYSNSIAFGDTVAKVILERAMKDNYLKSRGKPKYLGANKPGKWIPTQPDYLDGVEWCWNTMQPLLLDSASQFFPGPPPTYSIDANSVFFKAVKEVHDINIGLTADQKFIAKFWDDNPFVLEHSGHLMFGNKKITPGGHWMGIAAIAAKIANVDEVQTAKTYALTAATLFDAFISCWDVKYKWSYVRPVTVINEYIDKTWTPFLQTPPFPEYTSGHSTITGAAATVLTSLYGDNFSYQDTSDLRYIGLQRHFNSFLEAANECSISRLYGGIHYRLSVDSGAACGRRVGAFIINKLKVSSITK
jgi:PAP2 superfamily